MTLSCKSPSCLTAARRKTKRPPIMTLSVITTLGSESSKFSGLMYFFLDEQHGFLRCLSRRLCGLRALIAHIDERLLQVHNAPVAISPHEKEQDEHDNQPGIEDQRQDELYHGSPFFTALL